MSSKPFTWDPDTELNTAKQIATSARTISSLKLSTTGAGPATVYLYDTSNGSTDAGSLKWVMDAPAGGPDFNNFCDSLLFYKGIYAVLVQGGGLKPILNYSITPAPANTNPNA